jgi:predicted transcriptional regulator
MATKNAGDIMIPLDGYPHIPHTYTLRQAVDVMEQAAIIRGERTSLPRTLLVFDEDQQLLGMVRRRDILRGLEPKFLRTMSIPHRKQLFEVEVDPNLVVLSSGRIAQAVREQADHNVSEVMQPIVATVKFDDHLTKVIYKMIHWDLALLPVLKEGNVVGVVRSVDAFHEIAKMVLKRNSNH